MQKTVSHIRPSIRPGRMTTLLQNVAMWVQWCALPPWKRCESPQPTYPEPNLNHCIARHHQQPHSKAQSHAHTHSDCAYTCSYTYPYYPYTAIAHTHTYTHAHTHTHTHAHTHAHAHPRIDCTYTRTHTHAHTHSDCAPTRFHLGVHMATSGSSTAAVEVEVETYGRGVLLHTSAHVGVCVDAKNALPRHRIQTFPHADAHLYVHQCAAT